MALPSEQSSIEYTGNASTVTPYPIPFQFYNAADIQVFVTDSTGAITELVLNTDFVVSGGDPEGGATGSLVTVVAVPNTSTVEIDREVDIVQETVFTGLGKFPSASVDRAYDYLTMIAQQIDRKVDGNDVAIQPFARLPLATDAETIAGSITSKATSPHGVQAAISSAAFSSSAYLAATPTEASEGISNTKVLTPASGSGAVSVKFFGAVGDGVTDDTAALQTAINTAPSLFFPNGTYMQSNPLTIPSNRRLVGRTGGGAILKRIAGSLGTGEVAHFANSDQVGGNTNITIEDLELDGNAANVTRTDGTYEAGVGARLWKITNLQIRNLKLTNEKTFALQLCDVDGFGIFNTHVDNGAAPPLNNDGIHLNGGCRNGWIVKTWGNTGDDMIAANADDVNQYKLPSALGDIFNVHVDGIYSVGNPTLHAVRVNGGPGGSVYDCTFKNVGGSGWTSSVLSLDQFINGTLTNTAFIHDILFDGISLNGDGASIVHISTSLTNVTFQNIKVRTTTASAGLDVFQFLPNTFTPIYTNLRVNGLDITDASSGIGAAQATGFLIQAGYFKSAFFSNLNLNYIGAATTAGNLFKFQALTADYIQIDEAHGDKASYIFYSGGSPSITSLVTNGISNRNGLGISMFEGGGAAPAITQWQGDGLNFTCNASRPTFQVNSSAAAIGRVSFSNVVSEYTGGSTSGGQLWYQLGGTTTEVNISATTLTKMQQALYVGTGVTITKAAFPGISASTGTNLFQIVGTCSSLSAGGWAGVVASNVVYVQGTLSNLNLGPLEGTSVSRVVDTATGAGPMRVTTSGINFGTISSLPIGITSGVGVTLNGFDLAVDQTKLTSPRTYDRIIHNGGSAIAAGPYWWNGAAWVPMF